MRIWIKDPLAILATDAARGLVVEGTRIVELVAAGGAPSAPVDATFDASRHVVLPGLVNAHHHFYQTLTRAHPERHQPGAVSLADRALSDLGAAEAGASAPRGAARADRADALGLHDGGRSSLSLSRRASRTPSTSRSRRRGRSASA